MLQQTFEKTPVYTSSKLSVENIYHYFCMFFLHTKTYDPLLPRRLESGDPWSGS